MSSNPPFVLHRPKQQNVDSLDAHPHRSRLPVIPDLRFEHSYLRSIQSCLEFRPVTTDTQVSESHRAEYAEILEGEKENHHQGTSQPAQVLHIRWGKVLWITARDQVISPLLQGTLWAVASYFLHPVSAQLGAQVGTLFRSKAPPREGPGVGWLRDAAKRLGMSTGTSNQRSL
ncbi:hypothetical protein BD779DRAFT_1523757 [Infundibulicybe gibba]|nr:hypothetical protein BD779DRAFT_1523757 [Infundibulicybe gibba]